MNSPTDPQLCDAAGVSILAQLVADISTADFQDKGGARLKHRLAYADALIFLYRRDLARLDEL